MVRKQSIGTYGVIYLLIAVFINSILAPNCQATQITLYVDDSNTSGPWDGTQDFPFRTIQDGITAASSGDTIFVSSGTYNENVVITKNLTLIGENKDTTFIDGGGKGHTLIAYESVDHYIQVSISNLCIRNAGGSGFDCITFRYVTNGNIADLKILNSQGGEGISLDHCLAISIHDNVISNCAVTGISLTISSENIIENNIIQNNQNGIRLGSSSTNNRITSNTIRDNSMYGIYVVQSSNNIFSLNDLNGDGFTGNGQNAKDISVNSWSSGGQGNYWRDYNNYDNNSDGIGDTPYNIPGGSNKDDFPLGYFKQSEQPGGENQQPIAASIFISKTSATVGELLTFTGQGIDADGYITGYYWRSSIDGVLSSEQSFSTSTLSIGAHTIYFKVQDNEGAWSTEKTASLTINSLTNLLPTAYIDQVSPNPAYQGDAVTFQGHGSDQDGTIIGYKWISSKDGVISTTATFSKSNLSLGNHIIYFQVKDDTEDMSPTVSILLSIEHGSSPGGSQNHPPIADIGGPYQGIVNIIVVFNGSKSADDDGEITSYIWDYGDSSTGGGVSSTHVYIAAGTYTVTLKVIDDDGAEGTASTSIVIYQTASDVENPASIVGFIFDIPFPILIGIVILIMIGVIGGFLLHMRRK
jgi:parallel beta-helix repeat protein